MRKPKLVYGKMMDGYEYVEFMRKFNWKNDKGQYIFKFHNVGAGEYRINKMKFEGWEYWFDRVFPLDVFDEKVLITYPIYHTSRYYLYHINKFLIDNGFVLLEGELWI